VAFTTTSKDLNFKFSYEKSTDHEFPIPMQTSLTERSLDSNDSPRFANEPTKSLYSEGYQNKSKQKVEPLDYIDYAYARIVVQNHRFIN
jgi:hypothetical protein